jgi:hypothetical protein
VKARRINRANSAFRYQTAARLAGGFFLAAIQLKKSEPGAAMSELELFIPITKVDARQRLVYGIATAECEDRTGEICDYASTKPLYEKWSAEIAQSSGGKSRGNLRAMHGSVAAGKITALAFNDDAKQIEICAKVVDDAEWRKVEEGVYTGFSQGGAYARRWTDSDGRTRYTAQPSEISLVDLPCLPQAHFEMIKKDGSRVLRRFGKNLGRDLGKGNFEKGLDLVGQFAELVDELKELHCAAVVEAAKEGDGSQVPAQLKEILLEAADVLVAMTAEETGELDDHAPGMPAPEMIASSPASPQSMAQMAKHFVGQKHFAGSVSKLTFGTKLEDFVMPEFDFACFADTAGNVMTWSFAEAS